MRKDGHASVGISLLVILGPVNYMNGVPCGSLCSEDSCRPRGQTVSMKGAYKSRDIKADKNSDHFVTSGIHGRLVRGVGYTRRYFPLDPFLMLKQV